MLAVKRADEHDRAAKRTTTITPADARVRLADRDGDGTRDLRVAGGDRVRGKIARPNRGCDATGFTAETRIRGARLHKPKSAETPAPDLSRR